MFNVIKGEFLKKEGETVVLDYSKKIEKIIEKNDNAVDVLEDEEHENTDNLKLESEIALKKSELEILNEEINKKKNEVEAEISKMYEEAQSRIDYEIKVSQNRGYQDGYQAGVEKGREEIIQDSKEILDRVTKIHDEMVEKKIEILEENEEGLLELAYHIASKVVKKEIATDKNIIKNNLIEALKKVPISKKLTIMVNWEDLEYIKSIKTQLFSEIHGVEKIEIVENKNIQRGGCILETSMGTIDATINSQLEIIFENLMENVTNKGSVEETGEE